MEEKYFLDFQRKLPKKKKDHDVIGKIISVIPNKELSHTWNFTTKPDYIKQTIVTWKLDQVDKDKTKLTLVHRGFTNADRLQYDEHNEGWDWYVKRLENFLETKVNGSNE